MSASQLRTEIQYGLQNLLHMKPFYHFQPTEACPSHTNTQKNTTDLIAELLSLTRNDDKPSFKSQHSETVPPEVPSLDEHLAPRSMVSSGQVSVERDPETPKFEFNKDLVSCYCARCSDKRIVAPSEATSNPPRTFKSNVMTFRDESVMTSRPKDAVVEVNSSEITPILHSKHTFMEALKKCNLIYCKSKQNLSSNYSEQTHKQQETQKCGCLRKLKDGGSGLLNVFYPKKNNKEHVNRKLPNIQPTLSGMKIQNEINMLYTHSKLCPQYAEKEILDKKYDYKEYGNNLFGTHRNSFDVTSNTRKRSPGSPQPLNERERRRLVKYSAWETLLAGDDSRHTAPELTVDAHAQTESHPKKISNKKWSNRSYTPNYIQKKSNLKSVSSYSSMDKRSNRLTRPITGILGSFKDRTDESYSSEKKIRSSVTSKSKTGSSSVHWKRQHGGRSDSTSTSPERPRSGSRSPRSMSTCRSRPAVPDNWIPHAHGPHSMYHYHCHDSEPRDMSLLINAEKNTKPDKSTTKVEKSRFNKKDKAHSEKVTTKLEKMSLKPVKVSVDKSPTKMERLTSNLEKLPGQFHLRKNTR